MALNKVCNVGKFVFSEPVSVVHQHVEKDGPALIISHIDIHARECDQVVSDPLVALQDGHTQRAQLPLIPAVSLSTGCEESFDAGQPAIGTGIMHATVLRRVQAVRVGT